VTLTAEQPIAAVTASAAMPIMRMERTLPDVEPDGS
jgi:hypothetical protein